MLKLCAAQLTALWFNEKIQKQVERKMETNNRVTSFIELS